MKFDLPSIAKGSVIPHSAEKSMQNELKNQETEKRQFRHDYKVELFGIIGGAIAGFLVSLAFWFIEKYI